MCVCICVQYLHEEEEQEDEEDADLWVEPNGRAAQAWGEGGASYLGPGVVVKQRVDGLPGHQLGQKRTSLHTHTHARACTHLHYSIS